MVSRTTSSGSTSTIRETNAGERPVEVDSGHTSKSRFCLLACSSGLLCLHPPSKWSYCSERGRRSCTISLKRTDWHPCARCTQMLATQRFSSSSSSSSSFSWWATSQEWLSMDSGCFRGGFVRRDDRKVREAGWRVRRGNGRVRH